MIISIKNARPCLVLVDFKEVKEAVSINTFDGRVKIPISGFGDFLFAEIKPEKNVLLKTIDSGECFLLWGFVDESDGDSILLMCAGKLQEDAEDKNAHHPMIWQKKSEIKTEKELVFGDFFQNRTKAEVAA